MIIWADILLVVHLAWAAFMVAGLPLGLVLRSPLLRRVHAAGMGLTILFILIGTYCPLTLLEEALRGPGFSYGGSFLARLLGPILYPDLPPQVVNGASLAWAGLTALALVVFPPERPRGRP